VDHEGVLWSDVCTTSALCVRAECGLSVLLGAGAEDGLRRCAAPVLRAGAPAGAARRGRSGPKGSAIDRAAPGEPARALYRIVRRTELTRCKMRRSGDYVDSGEGWARPAGRGKAFVWLIRRDGPRTWRR